MITQLCVINRVQISTSDLDFTTLVPTLSSICTRRNQTCCDIIILDIFLYILRNTYGVKTGLMSCLESVGGSNFLEAYINPPGHHFINFNNIILLIQWNTVNDTSLFNMVTQYNIPMHQMSRAYSWVIMPYICRVAILFSACTTLFAEFL